MRKILFSLIAIAFIIPINAQNDTMYIMKNGVAINKQSIKTTDVDSIIFYNPGNPDHKGKYFPYVASDWSLLYKPAPAIGTYINDHTLYRHESTGKWHLIGITATTANPFEATYFAHGVSDTIIREGGYEETNHKLFETEYDGHLEPAWAPYAFNHDGKAYIFYGPQKISVRTSDDGMNWSAENCLKRFSPAWHINHHVPAHRDAMVIKIDEDGTDKWLLFATAHMNTDKEPYYSGVELFESYDLMNWVSIGFALTSSEGVPYYQRIGSFESPFVMKYGDYYYLSITYYGSNDYVRAKYTYNNTIVFRSLEPDNPYNFGNYNGDESMIVARLDTHAPEYIFDPETNKWYITFCGWPGEDIPFPGGVAIAELKWQKDYR